ncbi:MAG TPA: Holliday junction resolvase RuvX [Candidatus Limnocylindria bacterium]
MSRSIGLDHGSRRIGVAVGDSETGLAFARDALRRGRSAEADVAAVLALARREGAGEAIVGLPRNMDGTEGPQAAAARRFGDRLAAAGLAVRYVDERLTTWQAGEQLAEGGRRPDRRSGELDSAAARLILQEYLDAQRSHPRPAMPDSTIQETE